MKVSEAVESRQSVRGFLDKPVDLAELNSILRLAARAPSGGNLQPWHIHIVAGAKMGALRALMRERVQAEPGGEGTEYPIYPAALASPYRDRRHAVGEAMYAQIGIARDDKAGRQAWFARNYQFFGAPVGLFCFIDRKHGPPQWSDCGMYLQTLMLLLREAGLDSCPQECWALYHRTIADFLGVSNDQMLFTGMSIGWKDEGEPANRLRATRAPAEEFLRFHVD